MPRLTAWSHLPNAVHVDRILASVKTHPDIWDQYQGADRAPGDAPRNFAAWGAARALVSDAARDDAWSAAYRAARVCLMEANAWDAVVDAIVALIAWDHSAQYLSLPSDQLRVWWALSEDPACILLLSAVVAFEKIKELELA